jgi:nitroreductase
MDVLEAIRKRKSIRKFTPQPVPGAILKEILAVASRAPSAENTQPWEFTILEGAVLDRVREETIASLRAGRRPPDEMAHLHVERPKGSVFRERQVAIAKQLFALMGIGREDAGKRVAWLERGFRYFDAPHAIIVAVDDCLPVHGAAIDVGGVTQTICLAAMAFDWEPVLKTRALPTLISYANTRASRTAGGSWRPWRSGMRIRIFPPTRF